jgi:hypothetical protein
MKRFSAFRLSLLTSCAVTIGGATLLAFAGTRPLISMGVVGVADASVSPPSSRVELGLDFPICHSAAAARSTGGLIRLAQVEIPQSEMKAVVPAPAFADSEPPLWDGLGSIAYNITTSSAETQRFFNQGLRLTYAFNHDEARRAFRKAQRLDPDCAICFWGEALVLGPNINLPMQEDAVPLAYTAIQWAEALAAKASPRERALIAACVSDMSDSSGVKVPRAT